jgi:5-methylcytosine-specific restriction endonuclease McrA
LILDHVDGNADNWELANLRLVCPNCDAQLPTFKSRNRGNGRAYRRARYAAGRSY